VAASIEILDPTLIAAAPGVRADVRPALCANAPATIVTDARTDILAGRYRVDGVLAEGGMATVFRAWHCLLEQPVALKMLHPEYSSVPEIAQRFLLEARAVARLRSKHAVRVMDFGGTAEGTHYMVLELLHGKDLQQLLTQEGALPVERAVDFVLQAAEAVAEAHATGLVHRDLKPANLFLAKEDGTEIIKVIDFGICKSLARKSEYRTLSKSCLGSPQYMSPEQIQSAASVDARTDIWSLGVVLYELMTGRVPFRGTTLPALCASVMVDTPSWPEHLPAELGRIVMRCLEKGREDRYATVAQLATELARFVGATEPAPVVSELRDAPPHSNVRPRSRIRGWLQKAVACSVLGGAAAIVGWQVDVRSLREGAPMPSQLASPVVANAAIEHGRPRSGRTSGGGTRSGARGIARGTINALAGITPAEARVPSPAAARPARQASRKATRSPAAVHESQVALREPSTLDMEARYALTYEPDADAQAVRPSSELDSAHAPEPSLTGPPVAHSDL
jgi:serine/threonine-protein kinase